MGLTQITTGGVDDNINFDSNTLKVDGTNNRVGIGTASPSAALEVQQTSDMAVFASTTGTNNSARFEVRSGSGTTSGQYAYIRFNNNDTNNQRYDIGTYGTDDLTFRDVKAGSTRMTLDTSGNFGIGTTSPSNKLTLKSTADENVFVQVGNDDTSAYLGVRNDAVTAIETNQATIFTTGASYLERLRIDSSGHIKHTGLRSGNGENKLANYTVPSHDTSEEDVAVFSVANESSSNEITFGGGGSAYNAATAIKFRTASAVDTTVGTERMRIDSSGRVGIGTASAAQVLQVHKAASSDSYIHITNSTSGANSSDGTVIGLDQYANMAIWNHENTSLQFATNNTEKMRLDSSGRLLVNTSSSFNDGSTIQLAGSDSHLGLKYTGTSGGNEQQIRWFDKRDQANAVICNNLYNDNSGQQAAHLVFKTANAGTLSEHMRIRKDGIILMAMDNFSNSSVASNQVTGGFVVTNTGGIEVAEVSAAPAKFNRISTDGGVVEILQAGVQEGSISVSGSTVTYGGGHLARWSQLAGGAERIEILRGSVLSNLDEMCEWAHAAQDAVLYTEEDELPEGVSVGDVKTPAVDAYTEDNEQLNRMKVSDVEGDPNVAGVFQGWDNDDDTYTNDFYCAMTGDFVIRIAQGTTVARGDLLMSAGDGTAKPQDDDIVRSKTIAKVTSTTVSTTYSDGSYCVPCVLMAC